MKSYLPPCLWMLLIFILSSIPGTEFPKLPFPGADKVAHIIVYGILGILCYKSLKDKVSKRFVVAVLISVIYGFSDEVHQLFVPFRKFDIMDILSNSLGAVVGAKIGIMVNKKRNLL